MNLVHFCEDTMEGRKERRDYVGLVSNQSLNLLVKSFFNPVQWFSRVTSKISNISTARNLSEVKTLELSPRPTKWEAVWAAPVICNKRSRWFWNQRISDLEHTSHPSWFSWHLVFFKSLGQFHRRMSHIPDFYDCCLIFGSGLTFWQVWDYFIMLRSTWYFAIVFCSKC